MATKRRPAADVGTPAYWLAALGRAHECVEARPNSVNAARYAQRVAQLAAAAERHFDHEAFARRLETIEKRQDLIDRVRREGTTDRLDPAIGYEEEAGQEA